jgi:hypothetical protein
LTKDTSGDDRRMSYVGRRGRVEALEVPAHRFVADV